MPFRPEDWDKYAPAEGLGIVMTFEEWERQELAKAMTFLREHLPQVDLDCYPAELFYRFARHAVSLREGLGKAPSWCWQQQGGPSREWKDQAPWCAELPWDIFAHYVLFPRVNDEDLSFHREIFHDALWPWVQSLPTMEERILAVNRWCCEQAAYQAQTEARTASPLTVYRCGVGRCGELSAFLVSALRSVGIPARQVYAPRWSHCDDNHAWVEALCDGQWRFLGACEPEPVLDRGWFNTAASRAVLVHSWVFGDPGPVVHGEPLGTQYRMTWFDQTARYADTAERTFRALAYGMPAAGAAFQLQILNEASFHTIATLTADEQGTAKAALGRGSLHVCAYLDGLFAEGDYDTDEIVLRLAPPRTGDASWTDFDFHAPAASRPAPAPLDQAQKAARAHFLRQGADLRQRRQLYHSLPLRGRPHWEDLRIAARGNWGEIRAFLDPPLSIREQLVRTLPEKDLRDVSREVLEDHHKTLELTLDRHRLSIPDEIYWQYVACPRIDQEPLVPWRSELDKILRDNGSSSERGPMTFSTAYGGLYWTPVGSYESRRSDTKSARLYFIAGLRAQGWPARLRPLDGIPEIWEDGAFRPMFPAETGTLRLIAPSGGPLRAERDWSLSRWMRDRWELLHPGDEWQEDRLTLELNVGRYRIVTTARLPSGDQLARSCEIDLGAGEARTVPLSRRPWSAEDLLCRQDLPVLAAVDLDGTRIADLSRMGDGPVLALWLEEGSEPTEHVLNELMDRAEEVDALPIRLLFLVRGRDGLSQPTLAEALEKLGRVQILLGDWAYDLETTARCLGRDPDAPPLAVLCDGAGTALYSASGYRAGGVELLLRAARAAFPPA